ncbi:hypothetical protein scyTo_0019459 [Scyliorhinus torazame]|uniref:Uncharacterized protein n=1 Tax=Scyliorhinus torazame TaxID=75743 RepID=A0A401Q084_SCYTO|nr:hypothetical protein [Scyliorhinus torazame]
MRSCAPPVRNEKKRFEPTWRRRVENERGTEKKGNARVRPCNVIYRMEKGYPQLVVLSRDNRWNSRRRSDSHPKKKQDRQVCTEHFCDAIWDIFL